MDGMILIFHLTIHTIPTATVTMDTITILHITTGTIGMADSITQLTGPHITGVVQGMTGITTAGCQTGRPMDTVTALQAVHRAGRPMQQLMIRGTEPAVDPPMPQRFVPGNL